MLTYHRPGEFEKMFVINNHTEMSACKMGRLINQPVCWVKKFCEHMKIQSRFKSLGVKKGRKPKVQEQEEETVLFVRPPAIYSNRSHYGIATEFMDEY